MQHSWDLLIYKIYWGLARSTEISQDLLRSNKIYWDLKRSSDLALCIWHPTGSFLANIWKNTPKGSKTPEVQCKSYSATSMHFDGFDRRESAKPIICCNSIPPEPWQTLQCILHFDGFGRRRESAATYLLHFNHAGASSTKPQHWGPEMNVRPPVTTKKHPKLHMYTRNHRNTAKSQAQAEERVWVSERGTDGRWMSRFDQLNSNSR